jgi:hypothetical protein
MMAGLGMTLLTDIAVTSTGVRMEVHSGLLRSQGIYTDIVHLLFQPDHRLSSYQNERFRVFLAAARGGHTDILMSLLQAYSTSWDVQPELRKVVLWEAAYHGRESLLRMRELSIKAYIAKL